MQEQLLLIQTLLSPLRCSALVSPSIVLIKLDRTEERQGFDTRYFFTMINTLSLCVDCLFWRVWEE